jgi:ComF family protein
MAAVAEFLAAMADVLFPPACAACGAGPVASGAVFCALCERTVDEVPPLLLHPVEGITQLLSPFGYGGAVAETIIRCKHGGNPALAARLAQLASRRVAWSSFDVIVPAPLHRRRLACRGFNQSALIARAVSRLTGIPWSASILRRTRDTASQGGLSRARRASNVAGAFAVPRRRAKIVKGRRVLLVDDVWTTGATCGACAAALLRAGAGEVGCFTLCRVA